MLSQPRLLPRHLRRSKNYVLVFHPPNSNYTHRCDSDESLMECLTQGVPLCFCTDGGTLKHVGLIRWVITTDHEILWECTGSAFGWHTNSFRSEGLSRLSLSVFLKAFITFHCPTIYHPSPTLDVALPKRRPWIQASMDNQGWLKRLAQAIARQ
jgi:hypothetical protein